MEAIDFYSLFERSPIPMWVFDTSNFRFLDVNIAACSNYGYSKAEFLEMTINEIRPSEDVDLVKSIVKDNVSTGNFYKGTFKHIYKSGELIYVNIESNPIRYKEKNARIVLAYNVTEKLETEKTLLLSEQRFKALVQDASDLICILDQDLNYTYISPASINVFGVPPELCIGRNAMEFVHRDDLDKVMAEASQIFTTRQINFTPYRYRNINGNWIWIETKATNLFHDPAVQGIVCTTKEVTDRINHEKLILENVDRYNIVSKATSDVIWDCDFRKNTIIWNRAIKGILKYNNSTGTTTYEWWKQNIHEEDRERVAAALESHLFKGTAKWQEEYRFLCGDGTYKYFFDRGFVLSNEDGVPYRMIGAMQDITQRKEEEQWSKLLESVVINTTDGVLITNSEINTNIIYVNDALVNMSGFSRAELLGSKPDVLHGENDSQKELIELKNAVAEQISCKVELINYKKNGERYDVSVNLCPVLNEKGELSSWISIHRDITKQKAYVTAIETQNKKLKEISWMQSHVVRAPLARILSIVSLLKADISPEEKEEFFGYLLVSAEELDDIITEIASETSKNLL